MIVDLKQCVNPDSTFDVYLKDLKLLYLMTQMLMLIIALL